MPVLRTFFFIRFVYYSVHNKISKQCHSGIANFVKIGAVENILYLRGSMKFRTYLPDFTTDFAIIAKEIANNVFGGLWVSWKSEGYSHIFLRDVKEFLTYFTRLLSHLNACGVRNLKTILSSVSFVNIEQGRRQYFAYGSNEIVCSVKPKIPRKERTPWQCLCTTSRTIILTILSVCSEQSKCGLGLNLVTLCLRICHASPWAKLRLIFGLSVYIIQIG